MRRYTITLEGYEEKVLLKLTEKKPLGSTISQVINLIIRDWMAINQAKLKEWGVNLNQIVEELRDK